MKLVGGIVANVASQGYIALLGIVLLPIYLHFLGSEAFGLVALSLSLQAWLVILDFGMAPTLTRATATHRAGRMTSEELNGLLSGVLWAYGAIGFAVLTLFAIAAVVFSRSWFRSEALTTDELQCALLVMAFVLVLRWLADLFRSVHAGFERFVWLGKFNAMLATLRLILVVPLLAWTKAGVFGFFVFQLLIALLECVLLGRAMWRVLPPVRVTPQTSALQQLRRFRHFALTMALAGSCWVLVSQTDKVLLSALMTLSEFGEFTLAATAASAVLLATAPLSAVIMPRMTALLARNDRDSFQRIYCHATQWLGMVAWPLTAMFTLHAKRILLAWTGDSMLATTTAPLLQLYALGNGLLAVGVVAYVAQFARGDLKIHAVGSVIFVLLLVPSVTCSTLQFGAIGAAWVWLILNSVYLLLWQLLTHWKFGPYSYRRWLFHDVFPPAVLAFAAAAVGRFLPWPDQRLWSIGQIVLLGLFTLVVASLGTSWTREALGSKLGYSPDRAKPSGDAAVAQTNKL